DAGGARPLHRRARLSPGASHAGRRRPLRRVLGQALEQRDLSAAAGFCACEFVRGRVSRALLVIARSASDEAIHLSCGAVDCFASLAMTMRPSFHLAVPPLTA